MRIELSEKQSKAWQYFHDTFTDEILFGGGAGSGKTWKGCLLMASASISYAGSRNGIGRMTLQNLMDTTHITMMDVLTDEKFFGLKEGRDFVLQMGTLKSRGIIFWNGSEIPYKDLQYKPSDPTVSKLGGQLYTNFFIDEADEVAEKVKDVISMRVHRYPSAEKLDDWGIRGKLFMTCNPSNNWVKSQFYTPYSEGAMPKNKAFIPATLDDNPHLSDTYKDKVRSDTGMMGRRYRGDWEFDQGDNNLFSPEYIRLAFEGNPLPDGEMYITCDVARKGKDLSVILVWNGLNVVHCKYLETNTITDLKDLIVGYQRDFGVMGHHTIVDEDGIGGGLVDAMHGGCIGFVANKSALKKKNFANRKAQLFHEMSRLSDGFRWQPKGMVKDRNMRDYITQELSVIQEEWNGGKININNKDKIKASIGRSPDFADAISLRGYFELFKGAII